MMIATTARVLLQLRADRRTVALILVVPVVLLTLLYLVYHDQPHPPGQPGIFNHVGVAMLGILPFALMFLVTSIAMLRERSSGTLERLFTTRIRKFDLLAGYGGAFSVTAAAQAALLCAIAFWLLGLTVAGSVAWIVLIAVLDAVLGVGLGLLASAFARNEFQAVQFMPVVVFPQLFLCGLLVPRGQLPTWLEWISNVLPLSYAVDGVNQVARHSEATGQMWRDIAVIAAFAVGALGLAAASLRRCTP